jgi:hypothetical protein
VKGFLKNIALAVGISVMLLFSCHEKEKKADDILTPEQMVKVLSEIYLTEEKVSRLSLRHDSAEKLFDVMQSKVFVRTGVPDSIFRRSFNFYSEHPAEIEKIYAALVDSLQLREQRVPINIVQ